MIEALQEISAGIEAGMEILGALAAVLLVVFFVYLVLKK